MLYDIQNGDLLEVEYRKNNKRSFSWLLPGYLGDFIRMSAVVGAVVMIMFAVQWVRG